MLHPIILGLLIGGFLYLILPFSFVLSLDLGLRGARLGLLCRAAIGSCVATIVQLLSDAPAVIAIVPRPAPGALFEPMPDVFLRFCVWMPEIVLAVAFWLYGATRTVTTAQRAWIAGAAMAVSFESLFGGNSLVIWSVPVSGIDLEAQGSWNLRSGWS